MTPAEKLLVEQRRRDCLDLRIGGASMRKIAEAMNLSVSTVHSHIKAALNSLAEKDTKATQRYRDLNLQRLDRLLLAVWTQATTGKDIRATREARNLIAAQGKLLGLEVQKVAFTDPSGEIERKPSDWIMPVLPDQDPQEWAKSMQTMLQEREAQAGAVVAEALERAAAPNPGE
jgi:transposase